MRTRARDRPGHAGTDRPHAGCCELTPDASTASGGCRGARDAGDDAERRSVVARPTASTSSKPSRRQSMRTSGSGTAPVSTLTPRWHVPQYDISVTFECGADRRTEAVEVVDLRAGEVQRHRDAGHVAREEVDVLEHAADVRAREQVERAGDRVRVRQRPIRLHRFAAPVRLGHPLARVGETDGNLEAHQRDPVAADRVVRLADADRHRQPQFVDLLVCGARGTGAGRR